MVTLVSYFCAAVDRLSPFLNRNFNMMVVDQFTPNSKENTGDVVFVKRPGQTCLLSKRFNSNGWHLAADDDNF